jgi:hypothetical protein
MVFSITGSVAVALGQGIFRHFDGACPRLERKSSRRLPPFAEKSFYPFEFPLEIDGEKDCNYWFFMDNSYIRKT